VEHFLAMVYEDPDFLRNVWFSSENQILLDGYINRQTTRFLGFELPDVIIQKPLLSVRGVGAGFFRELRFPLPIYIPSASPQSSSLSPEAGTISQEWPQCQ
jgi:hypothetical protein